MKKGCLENYSGTYLSMESSSPYKISMSNNIVSGYTEEFCMKCSTVEGII
jgi:hypothetical protein